MLRELIYSNKTWPPLDLVGPTSAKPSRRRRIEDSEVVVVEPRGHGVLDSPPSRGMTGEGGAGACAIVTASVIPACRFADAGHGGLDAAGMGRADERQRHVPFWPGGWVWWVYVCGEPARRTDGRCATTLVGRSQRWQRWGWRDCGKRLKLQLFSSAACDLRHSAAVFMSVHYRSLTPQPARRKAASPIFTGERGE
ncbi:hypothetical protein ACVIJ6_007047 [Bradyrhizobium sp. USDA 4369]